MGCGWLDLIGLENKRNLRASSALRVRSKQMLKEGKLIEVEPGIFRLSEWYKTDLELRRLLPGSMSKSDVIAMLEDGINVRFINEG